MNQVLLFAEDFTSPHDITLHDARAVHIREILKGQIGQKIKIGILNKGTGLAEIIAIDRKKTSLKILETSDKPPTSPFEKTTLVIAMPRPQTLKKVLETAATFGVGELIFIKSERVEKSFFQSSLLKNDAYTAHLYLGLQQGGYTTPPQISFFQNQKYWDLIPQDAHKWIAHPGNFKMLTANSHSSKKNVIAIGPEGGWIEAEVELFKEKGFSPFSLGQTLHRVENAVCAVLAQLEILSKITD